MKDKVRNKLSKRQHEDEASWSTRSWLSLQAQRMSVALQLAAAEEIATELRLTAASEDAVASRLPCVTTCLPVFVAWRLCPVCAASRAPEFILYNLHVRARAC